MLRVLTVLALAFSTLASLALPAEPSKSFEVVARGVYRVTDGEKTTGTTEAGEVLTVLTTDQGKYWVQSSRGVKGWLEPGAVVRLADAESIYSQLIRANPATPRTTSGGR